MKKIVFFLCIILGCISQAVGQITVTDTLRNSFKLNGQTRRFKVAYEQQDNQVI